MTRALRTAFGPALVLLAACSGRPDATPPAEPAVAAEPAKANPPAGKARLGLTTKGTDGNGMQIVEIAADGPVRNSGLAVGDVIVRANSEDVLTTDQWRALMIPALDAGQTRFVFVVRDANGRDRTGTVNLAQ